MRNRHSYAQTAQPRYYTIVGRFNSPLVLGPYVTEQEVIDAAMFDNPMDTDRPDLTEALAILNEDGKQFEIYHAETERDIFIRRARTLGLEKEAHFIIHQSHIKL